MKRNRFIHDLLELRRKDPQHAEPILEPLALRSRDLARETSEMIAVEAAKMANLKLR
jgi:hypothetical protein